MCGACWFFVNFVAAEQPKKIILSIVVFFYDTLFLCQRDCPVKELLAGGGRA
jgi:hypothetical protein